MIFWLKKLVALFTSPLGLLLLVLVVGLLLAWRKRAGPWPGRLIVAAAVGLVLVCCGPTGDLLLRPLEQRHAPLVDVDVEGAREATFVVVLGGGLTSREGGPVTSELNTSSTIRLVEGIRHHRALGTTTLIVSGAAVTQQRSTADALAQVALDLGVSESELALADGARDTAEEAAAVLDLAGPGATVIVVTEASHMPRAMLLFERAGLNPIAAPTLHRASPRLFVLGSLWPSARNVRKVERAFYEYIALLWIALGGS